MCVILDCWSLSIDPKGILYIGDNIFDDDWLGRGKFESAADVESFNYSRLKFSNKEAVTLPSFHIRER